MLIARLLVPIVLTLNLLTGLSHAQAPRSKDRVQGWSADIDFLLDQAGKQHYIYKSKPLPEKLIEGAASLKKSIPDFSDERMLAELQGLIWKLGDGHSYVLPFGQSTFIRTGCQCVFIFFPMVYSSLTRNPDMSSGSARRSRALVESVRQRQCRELAG